ncbi:BRF1-domain-containing protein [Phellopilus nigrolimitatus]|nr:BRF1-domain-containing protein [Phellopilus nigrolimitatus]
MLLRRDAKPVSGSSTVDKAGNGFCIKCRTVIEKNTIVFEVTFGGASSGAVQGSFVGQGSTHFRMGGPFGNRNSNIHNIAVLHRHNPHILVAIYLCVACRQKEMCNYILIDFSDLLEVNVFELGHMYLQLVQTLNLRLPLTLKVAADAVRLAPRMNNFRHSAQVIKIADSTLNGALTLADFRTGKEREAKERKKETETYDEEDEGRWRLAGQGDQGRHECEEEEGKKKGEEAEAQHPRRHIGHLVSLLPRLSLHAGPSTQAPQSPTCAPAHHPQTPPTNEPQAGALMPSSPPSPVDATVAAALAEAVSDFLQNNQESALAEALDTAEQRRLARFAEDNALLNLDEAELDTFIFTEDEMKMKEHVCVKIIKTTLESLAARFCLRHKINAKLHDAPTPSGSTTAEAMRNFIKKSTKYSQ